MSKTSKRPTRNTVEDSISLLSDGQIFLFEDVNEKSTRRIFKQLYILEKKQIPITLNICSSGGDVECACAIMDKIQEIGKKLVVKTVVCGRAHSAAAFIMMSAENRYAYPNANIMFHPCHYGLSDYHDQNRAVVEFTESTFPEIMRFVTTQAHMGKRQARTFIEKSKIGLWLTSEEAKKMKIIHGIVGETDVT